MGASASLNAQTIQTDIVTDAVSYCPIVASPNSVDWTGVTISCPPSCGSNCNLSIDQSSVVSADCVLSNLQKAAAATATQLSAPAAAGLGWAVSANVNQNFTNIKQYTNDQCPNLNNSNAVNWNDVTVDTCNVTVTQDLTASTACQINVAQNSIGQISSNLSAASSGGSVLGDLFGGVGGLITFGILFLIKAIRSLRIFFNKSS